jgi:hypothetical protein
VIDPPPQFALAERVVTVARGLGIETALIGAAAFAVHNYVRATQDVDLATTVNPHTALRELEQALVGTGLRARLRLPDEDDVLGGVLVVWEREDEDGELLEAVEVVNFSNPFRPQNNPARDAIRNAMPLDEESPLRCVQLPDLVALKLYAGSRQDLADVVQLLIRNPDADVDAVRAAASPYDSDVQLETLIAEAAAASHHVRR